MPIVAIEDIPTFHTRAESWECDINGHWNTRFYMRSFQAASVMVASLDSDANESPVAQPQWHMRFHKELFAGAPIEIRSSRISGGEFDGAILHRLISLSELCATAIGGQGSRHLPQVPAGLMVEACPRGITYPPNPPWAPDAGRDFTTQVGFVKASELDHSGRLFLDDVMARCSHASNSQLSNLGMTPDFIKEHALNRMLLELRATMFDPCKPGVSLTILSRLTSVSKRIFSTAHYLHTRSGDPVAIVELCLVVVDLNKRKATDLPTFISGAMG